LQAVREGHIAAETAVMISNRDSCRFLAEEFEVPWFNIGGSDGNADDDQLIEICDSHQIDYIVLARYMRILSPASVWKYAGGRIINLHHGLLPSFPGMRPYHDAFAVRMLTYGATCHFIVPELDAGNQIINQSTFSVPPGTRREEIILKVRDGNFPSPREVNSELPSNVEEIILRAMALDPAERYATAREMRMAMQSVARVTLSAKRTPSPLN